jgi:WD40 repeat protein
MRKGERCNLTLSRLMIVLVISLLSCPISPAQESQPKDGRYYESLARKAYEQKDYKAFLENIKTAAEMRPNHPRLMYNLAAAYALTGHSTEALQLLVKMTEMGLVFNAEQESAFASIKSSTEFKSILKSIEHNKSPVINGAPAFTVHEKGFIPEGIAYDPVTETFFLGSVYERKIVSINKAGEVKDFATELDGLWSVMGMKVDATRRLLWVASVAHPQMSNYKAEDNGTSGIFKFDLRTGKLIRKYLLPNKPKPHWLGDLTLNSLGDLFTSDSISPAIYVIPHRADELELFLESESFISPQGLAFTPDEKHLFMADYAKGIFLVDVKTKKISNLSPSSNITLLGIDGLYSYQGSLIGVQNGINPHRLVRLFPSRDMTAIERLETIEANDPVFDEPTLGVLFKDSFYLIANSQWGMIDPKGQLAPADKLKEPVVLKIKL